MEHAEGNGMSAARHLPGWARTPTQLFIGGTWRDAADGATFDVISPTSEQRLATVAAAGAPTSTQPSRPRARRSTAARGRA